MSVCVCVQAVQLILDQCGGTAVNELEGVGADVPETDESGCRASGETPGNQRWEQNLQTQPLPQIFNKDPSFISSYSSSSLSSTMFSSSQLHTLLSSSLTPPPHPFHIFTSSSCFLLLSIFHLSSLLLLFYFLVLSHTFFIILLYSSFSS